MTAVAASAVAVDISRLLEPKGSPYPSRTSHSPSSGAQLTTPSTERPTSNPTQPSLTSRPEYSTAEPHQPGPQPGYAAGPHENAYPPHGYAPGHPHPSYGPVNPVAHHGFEPINAYKRPASQEAHPLEPPAKRQSKWTAEENELIVRLRGDGMKWDDVSKHLPGRSAISCRLHYQNFLERRPDWDEEKKNKLARLYERFRREMWERVAKELKMPWRAAEDMHWQLGRDELAQRAGVQPFHAAPEATATMPSTGVPITTSFVPSAAYQQAVYSTSPQSFHTPSYPPTPGAHPQSIYSYPPPQTYVPYAHPPPQQGPPHQLPPTSAPQNPHPESNLQHPPYRQQTPPSDPMNRPRRSESITGTPNAFGPRASRLSPGDTSPRRRALSASRIAANSIPPIESRARTPPAPASLPPLSREFFPGTPPAQSQQLPPVRLLTDEPPDDGRSSNSSYYARSERPREMDGYRVKADVRDEQARRSL